MPSLLMLCNAWRAVANIVLGIMILLRPVPSLLSSEIRTWTRGGLFSHAAAGRREEVAAGSTVLIIDTDMGFDDVLALRALSLSSPVGVDPVLVTTVSGVNEANYAALCARNLVRCPVVAGEAFEDDSASDDPWLPEYRQRFRDLAARSGFGVSVGEDGDAGGEEKFVLRDVESALRHYSGGDEGPPSPLVDLLCLGPLTNVASWVRDPVVGPIMGRNLRRVWIMGGNLPKSSDRARGRGEFNFRRDPDAAAAVLSSPYLAGKIRLVTEDVSGPASLGSSSVGIEDVILSTTRDRRGMLSDLLRIEPLAVFYDPVCAFAYANPGRIEYETFNVVVDSSTGVVRTADSPGSSGFTMDSRAAFVDFVSELDEPRQKSYIEWLSQVISSDSVPESNEAVTSGIVHGGN